MELTLGVDVSHWDMTVDWGILKQGGVEFGVAKCAQGNYYTDPTALVNFNDMREHGLITGLFGWHDPGYSAKSQVDYWLKNAPGKPDFYAVDVEQYWKDWEQWCKKKIVDTFSPKFISDETYKMCHGLSDAAKVPIAVYSSKWFLEEYSPQCAAWLADENWPLWLATYPYKGGVVKTTWEDWRANWMNWQLNPKAPRTAPLLPKGCTDWWSWQISGDKFVLPGAKSKLDLNWYKGSLADMRKWLGLDVNPPVKPELTEAQKFDLMWGDFTNRHPEYQ